MVKNHLDKNGSFTGSPKPPHPAASADPHTPERAARRGGELPNNEDVKTLSEDIDGFIDALSACNNKSNPPEVPEAVESFSKIIESKINKHNTCESSTTNLAK
ncbi:hypothetical protein HAX54_004229 [Datura stramonium]|uniref:Uncharacterized protein n=1 Tax=Datura stramonium TaxID=4076 RepID=A0ABS8WUV8_DATST|nr:hypothetical protein [Datura stramonium]